MIKKGILNDRISPCKINAFLEHFSLSARENLEIVQGSRDYHGAIYHQQGPLLIADVLCYWNQAGCYFKETPGGMRYKVRIVDTVIQANRSGSGAAMHGNGLVHLQRVQILDNVVPPEWASAGSGPAYYHYNGGRVIFEDVFMSGNTAPVGGDCNIGPGVRIKAWGENTLGDGCLPD